MIIINDINDTSLLDDIFSKNLVIYEDIKGFEIFVKWDGDDFLIKTDLNLEPINTIDEANILFYGKAISYLNSLGERVKSLLNKRCWYCFQYFPDMENNYGYTKKAKNNLVLCSIIKNNKLESTIEEVEEFARLMDVECIPYIYSGKLSQKTIEAIKYFLCTSEKDIKYIFDEISFPTFIYKLLNPQKANSFLMDNEFNSNIEKIILRINNEDGNGVKQTSFSLLNPLYKKISDTNYTEYAEIFSLLLINFLNFCQSINLEELKLKGNKRSEVYTYLICVLYNNYINSVKSDIENFEFVVPEFFNKDKFRINKEEIINKNTRELINSSSKLEYIFKCVYFSFRYVMKEPIGILEGNMLKIFNCYIEQLNAKIDSYLNKRSEFELGKKGLVDFGDFFDIKYDTDAEDKVYPNVSDEIKGGEIKKKKKLGGVLAKEDLGKK